MYENKESTAIYMSGEGNSLANRWTLHVIPVERGDWDCSPVGGLSRAY